MMLAYAIAAAFLLIAVALLLVWPLVLVAPGQRMKALASAEARFLSGTMASLVLAVILVPVAGTALISGGGTMQLVIEDASLMASQM